MKKKVNFIYKTNVAICLTIVTEMEGYELVATGLSCHAERFVVHQVAAMHVFLRIPFTILIFLFSISSLVNGGLFHHLSFQKRNSILHSWRQSRLGLKRDFVRFFDMLALFSLSERLCDAYL